VSVKEGYGMDDMIKILGARIVSLLNLQEITAAQIDPDEQLVGGRLGIDSIDVLEMVMMVEKDYGLTIENKELGAQVFASLRTLAAYIAQNAPETAN
jgi:acyl carrier protein